ncbi:YitT family protein [Pontibacillus salicampi]|uniref:YitT family protein n=1 Tax=Pontibacillus salicampi TaxID=1449801 RepID=A0ABV6LID3_9BACI
MLYRGTIYLLGMLVNFFGVALLIRATLGAGFWTALFAGLSDTFGFTVGFWYAIAQFVFIFANAALMKQPPEIRAIVPLVLESLILDFWLEIVFGSLNLSTAPFAVQVLFMITGVTLSAVGVAIYILPQLPRAPVDQLFLAISGRFNISLRLSQTLIASTTSTSAFFIGGPVGLGTMAGVLFVGPIIQFMYTRFYPIYYLLHPNYQARYELAEASE